MVCQCVPRVRAWQRLVAQAGVRKCTPSSKTRQLQPPGAPSTHRCAAQATVQPQDHTPCQLLRHVASQPQGSVPTRAECVSVTPFCGNRRANDTPPSEIHFPVQPPWRPRISSMWTPEHGLLVTAMQARVGGGSWVLVCTTTVHCCGAVKSRHTVIFIRHTQWCTAQQRSLRTTTKTHSLSHSHARTHKPRYLPRKRSHARSCVRAAEVLSTPLHVTQN